MSNLNRAPSIDASYQASGSFGRPNPLTNMATTAIIVSEWLISKKYSPLKPLDQIQRNLV
jgi:hypothetical protein